MMRSPLTATLLACALLALCCVLATREGYYAATVDRAPALRRLTDFFLSPWNYKRRIADLSAIREAIEHYNRDHGVYPESILFDGLHSAFGASEPDWIKGLAPGYLARLPADPRHDGRPDHQYLYSSNGTDYKLISYGAEDIEIVAKLRPDMIDPNNTCEAYGFWTRGATTWFPNPHHADMTEVRLRDLATLASALDAYQKKYGGYPVSEGFDGLKTRWGRSGEDWIKGLVPEFTKALPRDPRRNDDPANQYLYKSNGRDYKLISHHPEDCRLVKREMPGLIDPVRNCQAYGVWTKGGRDW